MAVSAVPKPVMKTTRAAGIEPPQFLEQIQPGLRAQPDVQQDHVRPLLGGQPEPFLGRLGSQHADVLLGEDLFDAEPHVRFIVDDQ